MKVLITGAFGWAAVSIIQALNRAKHQIIGFDLPAANCPAEVAGLFDHVYLGDIADYYDLHHAMQDVDAAVHLAVAIGEKDYDDPDIPFSVNVKGTYNFFESARRYGVQKIVLVSSAAVHLAHENGEIIQAETEWRSSAGKDHLYDLTKRLQEEIAKDFCETFQISAVVLRAGHLVDGQQQVDPTGKALSELEYCRGGWLCRYDLAAAVCQALELDTTGYSAYHVIGAIGAEKQYDIEKTARDLAMTFESRFERYG